MIVSHRHRFIFVKTAKTAGTSIEVALGAVCGPDDVLTPFTRDEPGHVPRNHDGLFNPATELVERCRQPRPLPGVRSTLGQLRRRRRYWHHMPAWQIRARAPRAWAEYTTFCVERNPWDKVVSGWSWYRAKYDPTVTMARYLDLLQDRAAAGLVGVGTFPLNLSLYTHPRSGEVMVDRILRYEDLADALPALLSDLHVRLAGPLPRAKGDARAPSDRAATVLDDAQVALVGDLFAAEIELHGYSWAGGAAGC